ncbi:DUF4139 domain-containing protein [Geminisphaera colitermitum]|uniref:DUF4139 domain-containing protein n=1 Tax=Geminisphaera colitermitum TaxID=1148786 RepID=UPI000158C5BE|nr:DUF4139 domain-containing protein [Geminisphaera colitermitum]
MKHQVTTHPFCALRHATAALLASLLVTATAAPATPAALTIYNQNFAVVRETIPLDLKAGVTDISFPDATLSLEPDSIVLRDPAGKIPLSILEQSYRAETASSGLMLSFHEGSTLDFLVRDRDAKEYTVRGKVIRSGYIPGGGQETPIVEVDGKLRFSLPGEPLFPTPTLAADAILRPTLSWKIQTPTTAKLDAELGYVTGGFSWQATYNLIAPEKGDTLDIVGWVTLENNSGKTFPDATIKLMAGNVNKIQPEANLAKAARGMVMMADSFAAPQVTEKSFDEFHLYSLPLPVTLRNRETKQVEFLHAASITAPVLYIYDGAAGIPLLPDYTADSAPYVGRNTPAKVGVYREIKNTKANHLGLALPKGRVRFYRQDDADGRIEFTGENTIDHTPEGETLKLYTGDAFDLVGERKQTNYVLSNRNDTAEETFEIKLRNRKKEPVEIRVTERLYRGINWQIIESSEPYTKKDSRNIEFRVTIAPDQEKTLTYRVRYDWK